MRLRRMSQQATPCRLRINGTSAIILTGVAFILLASISHIIMMARSFSIDLTTDEEYPLRMSEGGDSTTSSATLSLIASQKRIDALEAKIKELEEKLHSSHAPENTKTHNEEELPGLEVGVFSGESGYHSEDSVCHSLPLSLPSVETLWMKNIGTLFKESKHRRDPDWEMKEWTVKMMEMLTTRQLGRSIKTTPSPDDVRRVMKILQERRKYFLIPEANRDDSIAPPPKLKILVMGGSVTGGVMCRVNALNAKAGRYFRLPCAWPWRLNHYINDLLGFEAVEIENMSSGGLNSNIGSRVIEYGLYPEAFLPDGPDVIINAYSTNDVHVLSMLEAESKGLSLEEAVFRMQQNFIRQVLLSRCKNPPMIVLFDDYLGNEQNNIGELMSISKAMTVLAGYYNIMSISYADAVRQFVYGDTHETWFSPPWYGEGNDGQWKREIHPGMGAHISMVWVFAYNIFNAIISFCNAETFAVCTNETLNKCNKDIPAVNSVDIKGGTKKIPTGVPPLLTQELTLEKISTNWEDDANAILRKCNERTENDDVPCIFAWIAGYSVTKSEELEKLINPLLSSGDGWKVAIDNEKLGIVPDEGLGSKISFQFDNLSQSVRAINILAMKSYGNKWADSAARFSIFGGESTTPVAIEVITGHHESQTSVSYDYKINIDENMIEKGGKMRLNVELIGGSTFKITGMSICSR
uniref:Uncharacterized protein n=1 Tax=Leptocylindrus danicus TaxID=163516 RepID=A0A7S2JWF6_9STRA|mmetsp:Transcript_13049/g.19537  ORF Transcript_13049/g.19537 Transcript_13049/m.19537 type:complete len:694 (+) Transcript_13049:165-2246(+)